MRLILEGASGVGKSTLARALKDITGAPIYRPFRGNDEHISPLNVARMQDLGLSVNGWQEDLYTADLLSVVTSQGVILDRSMPSAMAWNEVSSDALDQRTRRTVLRMWAERIVAARAVLVLVECAEATRKERSPERGGAWEQHAIIKAMREACHEAPLSIWMVHTDQHQIESLARALAVKAIHGPTGHQSDALVEDVTLPEHGIVHAGFR